ncbi:uncharacterized protein SPPG_09073 [Spizellomyces punctatus DAOM BR117]|uniref:Ribonuclease H2 subunit B wHTH domain-containing protein n=1 Tax=Spizellomyces punctatus (strain DAOM BR117) TaxID=645134 RepID=A0A0L0HN16_SPIPD|nr:uncharacterized protein SPPG_09073 [Spizellomyces punctatus DAOM BR117]KND02487.1 hypothetical protein SPPG_09073 [Spizellomyces punctatus DAOM BR117]|eukprot:XP_016610526.1 hypothetical protein SPPG_09073 [Spizellomyces punctatus DAOM BR117]
MQLVDSEESASWFVDNLVQKDGSLYIFSPFDPLFLLLPILEKRRKKTSESPGIFLTLDDLLHDETYISLTRLHGLKNLPEKLLVICDSNVPAPGMQFFRLNDDKTLSWLKAKATRLLTRYNDYQMLERFTSGEKHMDETQKHDSRLRVVIRILGDCLPPSWIEKLRESYGFKDEQEASDYVYFDNVVKRPLSQKNTADADHPTAKKKKLTVGQRSLAKANREGMKSISSFFKK